MSGTRPYVLSAVLALGLSVRHAPAEEPAGLSVADFDRHFKQLHVKQQRWAGISWQTSLTEARKRAARENKPIFFNVNTGNALGFT